MKLISEMDFLTLKPGDTVFDDDNKPWEIVEMCYSFVRMKRQLSKDGFMYFSPSHEIFMVSYSLLQREKIKQCINQ